MEVSYWLPLRRPNVLSPNADLVDPHLWWVIGATYFSDWPQQIRLSKQYTRVCTYIFTAHHNTLCACTYIRTYA